MAAQQETPLIRVEPSVDVPFVTPTLYADYSLPTYASAPAVEKFREGKPVIQDDYGTTYMDHWEMEDEPGTRYKVLRCEAADPHTGLWIVKDTAWSTQPEGLNNDVARKLMGLGYNVLVKGPEIGSSIPLSESAYNTHQILSAYEKLGYLSAAMIGVEGYSRGSMIAFGTNAYAAQFGRKVLYSNLTDPCVALPVGVNKESVKKAATLPWDVALLGVAVAQGLAQRKRGRHLAKSVDLSPSGAVQFVRTGKPLMNGEAGMMATKTPLDMQATIAFFRRCRVNDAAVYMRILEDRPGVRFVRPEGGHGGGIDTRIIGNMAVRFSRLAKQIHEGRRPDELDYRHITYGLRAVS